MTTYNYLRATKAVTAAESTLGGPLREVLRHKLNEPGINVSTIAQQVNVQKATINYWMARLGINYGRVAHYFDEVVRILSQEESELLDVVLEKGLTADDVAETDPEAAKSLRRFQELGIPIDELAAMNATQIVALRRLSRMGLTDEQIDLIDAGTLETIAKLTSEGISSNEIASLTRDEITFMNNAREQGIDPGALTDVGNEWLNLIRESKQRGVSADELGRLTQDELALIEKIRNKKRSNPDQTTATLGMLDFI